MNNWPHSPAHKLTETGAYIVTAGTYEKTGHFNTPERLSMLRDMLLDFSNDYDWEIQAWAIMSNHYHFVAVSKGEPSTLNRLISKLHTLSAKEINRLDGSPGRKIWFQYWDTHITFQKSYLARLKYVNMNPVHHGIVKAANEYEWCSAEWFERNASPAFRKTVNNFKIDCVKVFDDF